MTRRIPLLLVLALFALAACSEDPQPPPRPTVIAFPTTTPGTVITGALPTPGPFRVDGGMSNPATAVARLNLPSPTPNTGTCPARSSLAEISDVPESVQAAYAEIVRYLSAGGAPDQLEAALRDDWGAITEDAGFVRDDLDLTGDGTAEIIVAMSVPGLGGQLLVVGCEARRYVERFSDDVDDSGPPQILNAGDINQDGVNDLAFAFEVCDADRCQYRTQIATWQPAAFRMAGLISRGVTSDSLPRLQDSDGDSVQELIVERRFIGDINTGPLRTGLKIYDWNGREYVLSITQIDPLRYQIQVIHEADRYLALGNTSQAVRLYQESLVNEDLQTWLRNEGDSLLAYTLYRLLLARTVENAPESAAVYARIIEQFPPSEDPAAAPPVYVTLATTYWDAFQVTGNAAQACAAVRESGDALRDAVDFLNRYGSDSPTYTARDMCPF